MIKGHPQNKKRANNTSNKIIQWCAGVSVESLKRLPTCLRTRRRIPSHQDEDFVPGARPVRISMSWKAFGRSIAKREENDKRRHSVCIFVVSEWTQAKTAVPPFLFLFRTANPKDEFYDMTKFGNRDGSVQYVKAFHGSQCMP